MELCGSYECKEERVGCGRGTSLSLLNVQCWSLILFSILFMNRQHNTIIAIFLKTMSKNDIIIILYLSAIFSRPRECEDW